MASWAFGWQFPPEFLDFIQTAIPSDPDPSPGYGEVFTIYDYAEGHLILYYQPPYMAFDPYLRDLANAMGEEMSVYRATLDRVLEAFYLEHGPEWGLRLWEAMSGVAVAPDNVTLSRRRAVVKSRVQIGPRTLPDFLGFIQFFTGNDGGIAENYSAYDVDVSVFAALTTEEREAFEEAFERSLPAHLGVNSYSYGGFIAGVSMAGDSL